MRQGDPLSPLLFVLAADLLQFVVNKLLNEGSIHLPIPSHDGDFPIVQYADDTMLILQADSVQLSAHKESLEIFSTSTGLDINYHKSCIIPINISDQRLAELAHGFGCKVGNLPFTYLGLPVGTTRPKMANFMPLVDCMERRLTASSQFLTQGGRLQLLNSVISSMPIYSLCSLHIPPGIIKQLERIQRQCLWRKQGQEYGHSLASWDLICRPKQKGGLGILNLSLQNEALLMKHLDKFYNKENVPWVQLIWDSYYYNRVPHATDLCGSLWWKDVSKLMDKFRACSSIKPGVGDTVLFWFDNWSLGTMTDTIQQSISRLFSYAKDPNVSLLEFRSTQEINTLFHLPLSLQAYHELNKLQDILANLPVSGANDTWYWRGKHKEMTRFSAKQYYVLVHAPIQSKNLFAWIWKSCCTFKIKVFAWLVIMEPKICCRGDTGILRMAPIVCCARLIV